VTFLRVRQVGREATQDGGRPLDAERMEARVQPQVRGRARAHEQALRGGIGALDPGSADVPQTRNLPNLTGWVGRHVVHALFHEVVDYVEHEQRPSHAQHQIAVARIEAERDEPLLSAPPRDQNRSQLAGPHHDVARLGR
jgi:hypothetical protein